MVFYDRYLGYVEAGETLPAVGDWQSRRSHAVTVTESTVTGLVGKARCGYDGGQAYWTPEGFTRDLTRDTVSCARCLKSLGITPAPGVA